MLDEKAFHSLYVRLHQLHSLRSALEPLKTRRRLWLTR